MALHVWIFTPDFGAPQLAAEGRAGGWHTLSRRTDFEFVFFFWGAPPFRFRLLKGWVFLLMFFLLRDLNPSGQSSLAPILHSHKIPNYSTAIPSDVGGWTGRLSLMQFSI